MMQDFRIAGGKVVVRELHTPQEVASLPEKLVFNCIGLGAKELFNDAELPIKGQLTFLLPQPEVEYSVVYGEASNVPPPGWHSAGRHHDQGDWSLNVDNQVRDRIVAEHKAFSPACRPLLEWSPHPFPPFGKGWVSMSRTTPLPYSALLPGIGLKGNRCDYAAQSEQSRRRLPD